MEAISLTKIKTCLDNWSKLNEKGTQCLQNQVLNEISTSLDDIMSELRQVLDTMFDEFAEIITNLGLEEVIQEDGNENIPKEINLIRNCIDMYDQEYMVKECIRATLTGEGFATKQHLSGCIALWKSESYIDEEIQEEIKKLP